MFNNLNFMIMTIIYVFRDASYGTCISTERPTWEESHWETSDPSNVHQCDKDAELGLGLLDGELRAIAVDIYNLKLVESIKDANL